MNITSSTRIALAMTFGLLLSACASNGSNEYYSGAQHGAGGYSFPAPGQKIHEHYGVVSHIEAAPDRVETVAGACPYAGRSESARRRHEAKPAHAMESREVRTAMSAVTVELNGGGKSVFIQPVDNDLPSGIAVHAVGEGRDIRVVRAWKN